MCLCVFSHVYDRNCLHMCLYLNTNLSVSIFNGPNTSLNSTKKSKLEKKCCYCKITVAMLHLYSNKSLCYNKIR